ncbi:MAG: TIGR04563 family protein [Proteobacteria bacterium]|nr:TIGR04563 family protein [Pseudomonadota bacterium]
MATKQKLTLYFPQDLLEEARLEAQRQERTVSWILQKAWQIARDNIRDLPGADSPPKPIPRWHDEQQVGG